MKQTIFDSEKEKYIHDDYHEKLLIKRYAEMQNILAAIELGNAKLAYSLNHNAMMNIQTVNQLYTPQEENIHVLRNQLISLNTLCMLCAFKANPNPLYLHTVSRHYDTMIEKVMTRKQADTLLAEMLEDYCSFSIYRTNKKYSETIQKAIWYITGKPARKLNLSELAEELGMSPSSLSRKFHSETGQTFSQYQMEFRIRTAQRYLQEGTYTITQAAHQVGFSDSSYFSKVFTKFAGCTPTQYCSQIPLQS